MADLVRLTRPAPPEDYAERLRIFATPGQRTGVLAVCVGLTVFSMTASSFWISTLVFALIASIAVSGLNLLTGFSGQISLGHAFFVGLGAYTAVYLGGDLELPFLVWLPAAGLVCAVASLLISPFALRLRGLYLAVATLALVFLGQHLFLNLPGITGGAQGASVPQPAIGPLTFTDTTELGPLELTPDRKWFLLAGVVLVLVLLAVTNHVRSGFGRALMAVRDHDTAAEILGVDVARTKLTVFALSSFYTGIAGALLGSYLRVITPEFWDLFLSVEYIAMLIVGGMGTVMGSVLGAFTFTIVPRIIERLGPQIPFIESGIAAQGLTVSRLNVLLYGLFIMLVLVFEPKGLVALWARIKRWFVSWPYRF